MSRPLRFAGGTQQVMIRLPREQYDTLMAITDRDGIPLAEQFRRAVTLYLAGQDAPRATPRPRATPKKTKRSRSVSLRPRHAITE